MRLTASSYVHRAAWQDAREHRTRFPEYKTVYGAPIRTCTELYGSATSVWVKVLPQSELMGPSEQCRFCALYLAEESAPAWCVAVPIYALIEV